MLLVPSMPEGTSRGIGSNQAPLRLDHLGETGASAPGHDGRPAGSLRPERQHRDRKAS